MNIRRVLPFLLFVLILLIPGRALAQGAWVPRQGEAAFSISYQWLDAKRHAADNSGLSPFEAWFGLDFDSNEIEDFGRLSAVSMVLDAEVGVTDRLTLTGGLAFTTARYLGDVPETPVDDGQFHGSVQNARIAARYAAVNDGTWSVTPFAAFVFPATDYAVFGHTAPGRGLNELQLGATVGRLLDIGGSPRGWFQGSYYYALMENVSEDITLDRSNLILDLGYFINKRLSANVLATWQKIHGGIQWRDISSSHSLEDLVGAPHLDDVFHSHDRAAATHEWRWGGGVSFQVSEVVEVYGSINSFLWGVNTHNATTFNFGVNVSAQLWGGGGLGMWASDRDDPDADMDDWLLEEFEATGDENKKDEEDEDEDKDQT